MRIQIPIKYTNHYNHNRLWLSNSITPENVHLYHQKDELNGFFIFL